MSVSDEAHIVVEKLGRSFPSPDGTTLQVLEDLSFDVPRGGLVSIVGPSGCGKSTLLNLVAGIDTPTTGEVRTDGAVGFVFQTPRLLDWRTVRHNVELLLEELELSKPDRRARVERYLELVGLDGYQDYFPHQISGGASISGLTLGEDASGFGDPLFEIDINLIGPKPIRNIPDLMRYEPGFSLDVLVDLTFPIGEYDSEEPLNLGQNRWYGRVGAPIVWQLGPWVPGRRTTLEFLPSLWLYGDNDDFVGRRLSTDPMFQLESHFTRDLAEHLWAVGKYKIFLKPSALKEIESIDNKQDRRRIVNRIRSLSDDPRPPGCEKLSSADKFRVRPGRYRIVYSVRDEALVVDVVKVAHRKDVYR